MSRSMLRSVGAAITVCLVGGVAGGAFGAEPVEAVRPAGWERRPPVEATRPLPPVTELVRRLDSPRFADRAAASRDLVRAGQAAVGPLVEAAGSDRPEVSARAVAALETLWLRSVEEEAWDVADAARFGLADLATFGEEPAVEWTEGDEPPPAALPGGPPVADRPAPSGPDRTAPSGQGEPRPAGDAPPAAPADPAVERAAVRRVAVAARAERILDENYELIQRRSIAEIQRLGGIVKYIEGITDPDTGLPSNIDHIIVTSAWTGGEEGLRHIEQLYNVDKVYIIRSAALPKGTAERLQAKMFRARVVERGEAFLGVGGEIGRNAPAVVTSVQPAGPAEKAGVRPGDLFATFNGRDVKTFDELIEAIKDVKPGVAIPSVVVRERPGEEPQRVELEITLEPWK